MFRILSASVLLVLASVGTEAAPIVGQFLSANGEYSAELSNTPENDLLVTVFKISKEGKTINWSRPIEWKEPYPGANSPGIYEVKALVTNDGKTVVLRDQNTPQIENDVRIVGRSEGENHTVAAFKLSEVTGVTPKEAFPPGQAFTRGMRMGASYLHVGAVLDFIVDEGRNYAIWFGQTDQWLLISLENFNTTVVRDPATVNRLNELALRKAEELALQHQPPLLRKVVAALREQLAKIAPSFGTAAGSRFIDGETAAAFLFLTARERAADRHFIEGLIDFRPDGVQRSHWMGNGNLEITFSVTQSERLIGDFLLSRWKGDLTREFLPRETDLLVPQDSLQFLGSIKLNFQLPMSIPRTNPGIIWACLIPAQDAPAKWEKASDLITFASFLSDKREQGSSPAGPAGRAIFRGVTPGDYRVKLIWERHPPAMGFWRTNIYLARAGDYDSAVTQPITVKAGETTDANSLSCTNRVGGVEGYAEDDRLSGGLLKK